MPKFKKKGVSGGAKVEELFSDHFTLRKTAFHGFPTGASAISFEPVDQLLSVGTKNGELRVYGRPGVEFRACNESGSAITHISSFHGLHQFITVSANNSVELWALNTEGQPILVQEKELKLDPEGGKTITKCCLAQRSGHFYIGTECGNIFILELKHFQLESDIIYWSNATSLVQPSSKTAPGAIQCLELCPTDPNLLLIGYEKGIITLWDLDRGLPSKNFPTSIQDCQEVNPLDSISWQNEGVKFVTSHSDASIYFWNITSSSPSEGPTNYYAGEGKCLPVTKIKWLNTDASPLLVFSGGLPEDAEDEHHTVTVIQGAEHVALDFSSPVVDFIPVIDPATLRGKALFVLCEQELLAFDLEAPKCPLIRKPYLFSLHASPVTCVRLYENCSKEMFEALHEITITSPPAHEHFSTMEWPAMGGCVLDSEPDTFDILVTGHENGMIKFWDVTTGAMSIVCELKTANLFVGQEPDNLLDEFVDFLWPPYRKVSTYDPFEDDPRLSIKFIEFCQFSKTMCIGGNGGQVITFSLNPSPNETKIECVKAEIFVGSETKKRGAGLRNEAPLECKTDYVTLPAGFQANFCVQCLPATAITAIAFRPSWGLVAAGTSKGFAVANFLVKSLVFLHPTVLADGTGLRSLGRVQSLRRSIRDSFRRRRISSAVSDDRHKIVNALNVEGGIQEHPRPAKKQKGVRARASSEPASTLEASSVPSDGGGGGSGGQHVPPELAGYVTHLVFAETYVSGGVPSASLFASTMGSVMVRYHLTLPPPQKRLHAINRALVVGKDYALVHAAPIVALFVLDNAGVPIPDPYEIDAKLVPIPVMRQPHYAVIVTQEQIKLVTLPGMRQKRKEKLQEGHRERVHRAWLIRVKVAGATVGAKRDWNPGLCLLTASGSLIVFSLPDLRMCFLTEGFINPSDHKALMSVTTSLGGEVLSLRSFSELERSLLCSYSFSFHTTMLPSLFPFDGSTQPVKTPRKASVLLKQQQQQQGQGRGGSPMTVEVEVQPDKPAEQASKTSVTKTVSGSAQAEKPKEPEVIAPPHTSEAAGTNGIVDHTDGGKPTGKRRSKSKSKSKSKSPTPEKDYSAKVTQDRRSSESSSGNSSSSESDSSDDDDDEEDDLPTATRGGATFGNPLAFGFDELGDGSKELDNIIASSLQQLESARAFYEQMQARVKKTD